MKFKYIETVDGKDIYESADRHIIALPKSDDPGLRFEEAEAVRKEIKRKDDTVKVAASTLKGVLEVVKGRGWLNVGKTKDQLLHNLKVQETSKRPKAPTPKPQDDGKGSDGKTAKGSPPSK